MTIRTLDIALITMISAGSIADPLGSRVVENASISLSSKIVWAYAFLIVQRGLGLKNRSA